MISWLDPCDLVIVEGYKRSPIPKIEVRRRAASSQEPLAGKSPNVIAIAADHAVTNANGLPSFPLDEVGAIADFIAAHLGLTASAAQDAGEVAGCCARFSSASWL